MSFALLPATPLLHLPRSSAFSEIPRELFPFGNLHPQFVFASLQRFVYDCFPLAVALPWHFPIDDAAAH